MNQLPLLDSIQFQRALSLGANVTVLAANIRNNEMIMTGSGIYTPFSATYHHAEGEPEEGRLLVARVPVLDPLWVTTEEEVAVDESGSCPAEQPGHCQKMSSLDSPGTAGSVSSSHETFISTMMYDPFTFALLHEPEGDMKVCNGSFCCYLQYRRSPQGGSEELYALGAFAGTHVVNGRYAVQVRQGNVGYLRVNHDNITFTISVLQVCALVRCGGLDPASCGQEVDESESKMDFVLEGTFEAKHVYPSILASKMVLEQPQHLGRTAGGRVSLKHSNMTDGLVTACLYGRMYHLDNQ